MSSLDILIKEQRGLLDLINKHELGFNKKSREEKTHGYLNSLAQLLDDIFTKFESQHGTIVRLVHESSMSESDVPYLTDEVFFHFSEKYLTFKGHLIDSLPDNSTTHSPLTSTFSAPNNRSETIFSDTRLPKINLPKFSGDYIDWVPFQDLFSSLVHNNDSLNKVQKFFYLKSSISGEAANLIKTFSATEANYDSAWQILEARYHNKRMLVGNLISKLFNIPKSDGGFQSIKIILDSTQECLASLSNLGLSTISWDPILIHLIIQKLDLQTRRDWENSLKSSSNLPSRSELFSFLERTFRTLESLSDQYPTLTGKPKFTKTNKFSKKTSCHTGRISKSNQRNCLYCEKSNHSLPKCYKFLSLSLDLKNEFILSKNICRNCLTVGHNINNCDSPFRCVICREMHHTILHPNEPSGHMYAGKSDSNQNSQISSNSSNTHPSILLYTIRLNAS